MKKNRGLLFTKTVYVLFLIATIIALAMIFININEQLAFKFLSAYVFFAFFMLLYIPFITIVNARKLKWVEIKKRILKFIGLFILFGVINYGIDYFFRPSRVDLMREFSTALGLAFGISFIDITLFKKDDCC